MILKCISLINLVLSIICCMKGLQAKDIHDADHFVMRVSKAACFAGVGCAGVKGYDLFCQRISEENIPILEQCDEDDSPVSR